MVKYAPNHIPENMIGQDQTSCKLHKGSYILLFLAVLFNLTQYGCVTCSKVGITLSDFCAEVTIIFVRSDFQFQCETPPMIRGIWTSYIYHIYIYIYNNFKVEYVRMVRTLFLSVLHIIVTQGTSHINRMTLSWKSSCCTEIYIYLLHFTLKSTTQALDLKQKPLVVRSTDRGRYPSLL